MEKSMRTLKGFERETEFTKWLSNNLSCIGELINKDVKGKVTREYPVGNDRLDIYVETNEGKVIAIENQYGVANDEHYGKLMKYAAKVNADIIILISEAVYEESWKTMEWLESISNKEKSFYHIIVEAKTDCEIPKLKLLDNNDVVKKNKRNSKKTKPVYANELEKFWIEFGQRVKSDFSEFEKNYSYNLQTKESYITVTPTRLKKTYNFNVVFRTSLNVYYAELKFIEKNLGYFEYMK